MLYETQTNLRTNGLTNEGGYVIVPRTDGSRRGIFFLKHIFFLITFTCNEMPVLLVVILYDFLNRFEEG